MGLLISLFQILFLKFYHSSILPGKLFTEMYFTNTEI